MIFYFSGTGNSLYAAKTIGSFNHEKLVSISSAMKTSKDIYEYHLERDETVGFVFPIYAWGPPKIVLDFIDKLSFPNYNNNFIFSVATCGANIGNTMKTLNKHLKENHLNLMSGFSVIMPNNYMIAGDVDSKDHENNKLMIAEQKFKKINEVIKERKKGVFELEKGLCPFLLTTIINPAFNMNTNKPFRFHVKETCTRCGICERVCNCNNIKVTSKPNWESRCVQCLACINYCPVQAIQYGRSTEKKGRYKNPNINVNEMYINKID